MRLFVNPTTPTCINWRLSFHKYFGLMIACLGRNYSPNLTKYKIVVFDEVYILFHFNKKKIPHGYDCTKLEATQSNRTNFVLKTIPSSVWNKNSPKRPYETSFHTRVTLISF
jgi:hypothetical protein